MLVLTRHPLSVVGSAHVKKTGIDIGRRSIQVLSIDRKNQTVDILMPDGATVEFRENESDTVGRTTVTLCRIGTNSVKIGIKVPKNINIFRWDI